jgi:hypothetical protein
MYELFCSFNFLLYKLNEFILAVNILNDVTKEKLVRKLPSTMTIQRLKGVVSKLFITSGFDADLIRLKYISEKVSFCLDSIFG